MSLSKSLTGWEVAVCVLCCEGVYAAGSQDTDVEWGIPEAVIRSRQVVAI